MATAAKPEVFSRKASGLSRVMSPWSAYMYNFLTMGVIFPWTFVWAPAAFPGVSVWQACLYAILLELPIALAYVWMATAMPRSGGDYVFQSRVLGGAIGFPVVMSGFVVWILQWVALAGWLLAVLGVAPLLMGLGVNWNNQSLIDAAVWCQSAAGVDLGASEAPMEPALARSAAEPAAEAKPKKAKVEAEKPKRVSIPKGLPPAEVDLDTGLRLLALPREVGKHPESNEAISAGIGRFGPYLKHGPVYKSLADDDDVLTIGLNRAVVLLAEGKQRAAAVPGRERRLGLGRVPQRIVRAGL